MQQLKHKCEKEMWMKLSIFDDYDKSCGDLHDTI
jgi:hypothetical protein